MSRQRPTFSLVAANRLSRSVCALVAVALLSTFAVAAWQDVKIPKTIAEMQAQWTSHTLGDVFDYIQAKPPDIDPSQGMSFTQVVQNTARTVFPGGIPWWRSWRVKDGPWSLVRSFSISSVSWDFSKSKKIHFQVDITSNAYIEDLTDPSPVAGQLVATATYDLPFNRIQNVSVARVSGAKKETYAIVVVIKNSDNAISFKGSYQLKTFQGDTVGDPVELDASDFQFPFIVATTEDRADAIAYAIKRVADSEGSTTTLALADGTIWTG